MDLQQLVLRISGDSSGAEKALGNVGDATNKFGGIVKSIIAGAAVAAMVKWTETTINLGIEAEKAGALLDSTMKHALNSTNEQVAACKAWAENQEKVNHFDAEELMAQLDKGIVKYGDLGTAQVAVSAAQEVARLKGIDVASAYSLVEQASNGMARSLKQFGIEAVAGTSQLSYLQQMLDKTNGSTEAYNKTTAGMIGAMKQSYEVMRETLGQALLPIVNTLMTQLSPMIEHLTAYIVDNMPTIETKVKSVCSGIASAFEAAKPILDAVWNTMSWIIKSAGIAIDWINKTRDANEVKNAKYDIQQQGYKQDAPTNYTTDLEGNLVADYSARTGGRGSILNWGPPVAAITKVKDAYVDTAVAAIDSGIAATKASTTTADAAKTAATKVADVAKAAAEAIKQARQAISDKIYTLTHTDQQNEQHALDVEYAANIKSSKDKLASKTLYTEQCNALLKKYADIAKTAEEEQTAKTQEELDKRLAAQKQYNDAVVSATKKLTDQIYAATHDDAQKQAQDIANQAASSLASGVDPSIIAKYVSTMGNQMQSDAGAALTAAVTLKPGQTSFTPDQLAEITRLQGNVNTSQSAVAQYLSAPLKVISEGITTLIGVTAGVASGVGSAINGMGGGGRVGYAR